MSRGRRGDEQRRPDRPRLRVPAPRGSLPASPRDAPRPRGIRRGAVDQWEPDLGPSVALLSAYRVGEVTWDTFAERYRVEVLGRPRLIDWAARMASGTGVTLLCGSHPDEECHRSLLAEVVRERLAQHGTAV